VEKISFEYAFPLGKAEILLKVHLSYRAASSCPYFPLVLFFNDFFFPLPPLPDFTSFENFGKIPGFGVEEKHTNAPHLTG